MVLRRDSTALCVVTCVGNGNSWFFKRNILIEKSQLMRCRHQIIPRFSVKTTSLGLHRALLAAVNRSLKAIWVRFCHVQSRSLNRSEQVLGVRWSILFNISASLLTCSAASHNFSSLSPGGPAPRVEPRSGWPGL